MVFSSVIFLCLFLPIVLGGYYLLPKREAKNLWLIAASLLFYAFSGLWYVLLLLFSVFCNYLAGLFVSGRKGVLYVAVAVNLGVLGVFKYLTFLVRTVNQLPGVAIAVPSIVLPVGISFFTFQGLSYVIDVYRNERLKSTRFRDVLLYIALFPQLVAGPIVRYEDVADEIKSRRHTLEQLANGLRRFIIGLSKKLMIADVCGSVVTLIYSAKSSALDSRTAWLAAVCYLIQIYFDFSGYSDMAIGLGLCFGFHFKENFNYPYISKSITEFWRRWHMTLGAWFKDYIFYPVTLSKTNMKLGRWAKKHLSVHLGQAMPTAFALFFVWLANGLWHGAAWKYVAYGMYYYVLTLFGLFGKPVIHCFYEKTGIRKESRPWQLLLIIRTFILVNVGMLLFRANSLRIFAEMFESMFRKTTGNWLELGLDRHDLAVLALGALLMLMVGIVRERGICIRERIASWPMVLRWTVYAGVFCAIVLLGAYGSGYGVVDPLYANF